jgi:probable HAF family extracellular repeat protein
MRLLKINIFILAGIMSLAVGPAFGTTYLITDLGNLGGGSASAEAINTNNQITGSSATATGLDAFLYSGGTMHDLGNLGGASSGLALNNLGHVAGGAGVLGLTNQPFLFRNGSLSALGLPAGANSGQANSVNDSDQVVGEFVTGARRTAVEHAFLWQNGTFADLGALGGSGAYALAIDDAGQIVGAAANSSGEFEAFLWQNGVMTGLGILPGGYSSAAAAINHSGAVVGSSSTSNALSDAVLFENGNVINLGVPPGFPFMSSSANAINDSGVIVGTTSTGGRRPTTHAFIFQNGVITDLNNLVPGNSGSWVLNSANGITDAGIITGTGTTNGVMHAFLLTPTTAVTVPAAPIDLTSASSNAVVSLSWMASFGATSYNVLRSTSSSGPFTAIGSVTSTNFTDTSVVNCTLYTYEVNAANSAGQSPNSSSTSGDPESVPAPPVNLTAKPNTQANLFDGSAIVLAWVNNTTTCEQELNIERSTDGVNFQYAFSVGPNQGSIVDGFLNAGTRYYYRIRAVSTGGESGPSNVASAVAPPNSD